eukprot:276233-Rhodomonas_salina.1
MQTIPGANDGDAGEFCCQPASFLLRRSGSALHSRRWRLARSMTPVVMRNCCTISGTDLGFGSARQHRDA